MPYVDCVCIARREDKAGVPVTYSVLTARSSVTRVILSVDTRVRRGGWRSIKGRRRRPHHEPPSPSSPPYCWQPTPRRPFQAISMRALLSHERFILFEICVSGTKCRTDASIRNIPSRLDLEFLFTTIRGYCVHSFDHCGYFV